MLNRIKNIAKALLAITWIRRTYEITNTVALEVFGWSRVLTHILYFFMPLTFSLEQFAVLRGRRDYYRNKRSRNRRTSVELRRKIHRLEKGLTVRPRRDVFALDYITETIEFYENPHARQAAGVTETAAPESRCAHDALKAYFAARTGSARSRSASMRPAANGVSAAISTPAGARSTMPDRSCHPSGSVGMLEGAPGM